jgi:hypothetical protein
MLLSILRAPITPQGGQPFIFRSSSVHLGSEGAQARIVCA